MAVVSWSHKYLCVLSPGTGRSSLGTALLRSGDRELIPNEDVIDGSGKIVIGWKHTAIKEPIDHNLLKLNQLDSLLTFTATRNPFDFWAAEWYRKRFLGEKLLKDKNSWLHKVDGAKYDTELSWKLDLSQWIVEKFSPSFEEGVSVHTHGPWIEDVHHVMRFESLQADFNAIMKDVGLKKIKIPRINVRRFRDRNYRDLYDQQFRMIVERVFAPDIERFGYCF